MKKNIKLIAFDIDGTLIDSKGQLLEQTKTLVKDLKKNGFKVVLCTGRNFNGYWWIRQELGLMSDDDLSINSTGVCIRVNSTGKALTDKTLKASDIRKIEGFLDDERINFLIHTRDIIYANIEKPNKAFFEDQEILRMPWLKYESLEDIPQKFLRACFTAEAEVLDEFEARNIEKIEKDYKYMRNASNIIEVLDKRAGKCEAMQELTHMLGLSFDNVMYFGDGANDAKTLEAVGVGVAMGNARDICKEVADYVIESNDQPGIAKFVRKYLDLNE